jgi:hypothetical protein
MDKEVELKDKPLDPLDVHMDIWLRLLARAWYGWKKTPTSTSSSVFASSTNVQTSSAAYVGTPTQISNASYF